MFRMGLGQRGPPRPSKAPPPEGVQACAERAWLDTKASESEQFDPMRRARESTPVGARRPLEAPTDRGHRSQGIGTASVPLLPPPASGRHLAPTPCQRPQVVQQPLYVVLLSEAPFRRTVEGPHSLGSSASMAARPQAGVAGEHGPRLGLYGRVGLGNCETSQPVPGVRPGSHLKAQHGEVSDPALLRERGVWGRPSSAAAQVGQTGSGGLAPTFGFVGLQAADPQAWGLGARGPGLAGLDGLRPCSMATPPLPGGSFGSLLRTTLPLDRPIRRARGALFLSRPP